ncbi:MAG: hypothetical protein R2879_18580 [Saprospiraceae bacterium]
MDYLKKLIAIIFIFSFGCIEQKPPVPNPGMKEEIENLTTESSRKSFLEQILKDDQKVRGDERQKLLLKYGNDSKEVMDYTKSQWAMDSINLLKITAYLEVFGYPSKEVLGKDASTAPWIVVHHCTDPYTRNYYFEALYKAYLNEDLDYNQMSLYLGRTYDFIFRKSFEMESPFKPDDKINALIEALDLNERKEKVLETVSNDE